MPLSLIPSMKMYLPKAILLVEKLGKSRRKHRNLCRRFDPQRLEQQMSSGDLAVQVSCGHQCCCFENIQIATLPEILQITKLFVAFIIIIYKAVFEKCASKCLKFYNDSYF